MKIGFFDFIDWDYNAETPYQRALGGGQSAFCYLSAALADRGHEVMLVTQTTHPGVHRGVDCRALADLYEDEIQAMNLDAMIILNAAEALDVCMRLCGPNTRLILWAQHASDQPAVASLRKKSARMGWNGVACCTDYHRQQFLDDFGLDADRTVNLGNAVAPPFERMFTMAEPIAPYKPAPVMAYTSTPFRGLDWLLEAFPAIKSAVPDVRLKVYSSMKVYNMDGAEDAYGDLYKTCTETDGIDYMGSVSQFELAKGLKDVKVLAYSNTFAEMQCISVMEAMAAGARVVTSDLAALPETCHGLARLVPFGAKADYLPQFIDAVVAELTAEPDEKQLRAARRYYLDHHTWAIRARQWEDWLFETG